jgi:hypothetical protein
VRFSRRLLRQTALAIRFESSVRRMRAITFGAKALLVIGQSDFAGL